ncbi:hypothetical protein HK405_003606 [Cladochytrium tenue]|nr:hypothetical protein HK405_003606 [Cladochytrium tenue]
MATPQRPELLFQPSDLPRDKLGAFYQNLGRDNDLNDADDSSVPYYSDTEADSHHRGHDYPHSKKPTADGADRTSLLGPAGLRVPYFGPRTGGNGGRTHGTTSAGEGSYGHATGGGKPGPSLATAGQGRQASISPVPRRLGGHRGEEGDSDHGLPSLSHHLSKMQMGSPVGGGRRYRGHTYKGGHEHENKSAFLYDREAEHLNSMLKKSVARLSKASWTAKAKAAKANAAKAVAVATGAASNAAANKANNDTATYAVLKELRSARLLEVEWAAKAGRAVATSVLDGHVGPILLQQSVRDAARMYRHDGGRVPMVLEMFASHVASAVDWPEFAVDKILQLADEEVGLMMDEENEEVSEDEDDDDDGDDYEKARSYEGGGAGEGK